MNEDSCFSAVVKSFREYGAQGLEFFCVYFWACHDVESGVF